MKQISLLLLFLSMSLVSIAQVDAPDFTVTDLDGVEHNLFSILDDGKVVVLDVSATWCGPCWSWHNAHYLEMIHEKYGPDGTDQVRVIFYEGDANTGDDAIHGTGGSTLGDWVTGVSYPIINESPVSLDLNIWAPLGFPTINVISPDKKIVADLFNFQTGGIEAMYTVVESAFPTVDATDYESVNVELFPNPTQDFVVINMENMVSSVDQIVVVDLLGQSQINLAVISNTMKVDLSSLASGSYIINLSYENELVGTKKIVKN